jgi:hypothetical protein
MRECIEKGAARECGDAETIESALKPRFRCGAFSCLLFTYVPIGETTTQREIL